MRPLVCNFYLTFRSNDSPEYASLWREEELLKIPEAKAQELKNTFRDLAGLGIKQIYLEGGEPLLRQDLPELLALAKAEQLKVLLTTNGFLFPERAKELAPHLEKIYFWLDSPLEEEHNRVRGLDCFAELWEGIDLSLSLGMVPRLKYALTRDSVRFLPELAELVEAKKIPVYLEPVYDKKYNLLFFEDQTIEHIKYYQNHPWMFFNLAFLEFIKNRGNQTLLPRCRAVSTVITIFPDQSLAFPCFYLPKKRVPLEKGLKSIYTTPGFLKHLEKEQGAFPECQGCTAFSYMLPSFRKAYDRYFLLNWYSDWWSQRKTPRSR